MNTPRVSGLVLAGGTSRRMGFDKAAIVVADEPQVVTVWRLLSEALGEAVVSVRTREQAAALPPGPSVVLDGVSDAGPMAGIVAAHRMWPDRALLVVAVDTLGLEAATVDALLAARTDELNGGRAEAVALARDAVDGPEPLCAIWEPSILRRAAAAFDRGARRPRALLADVAVRLVPRGAWNITNVNTPAELAGYLDTAWEVRS